MANRYKFIDVRNKAEQIGLTLLVSAERDDQLLYRPQYKEWPFKCFCGQEFKTRISDVLCDRVKSCGCLHNKYTFKDVREKCNKFNIKFLSEVLDSLRVYSTRKKWDFQCKCGKIFQTMLCHILSGHTLSCGCLNKEKTTLYTFKEVRERCVKLNIKFLHDDPDNQLIYETKTKNFWNFQCNCKNKSLFSTTLSQLMAGQVKSCGCRMSAAEKDLFSFVKSLCSDAISNSRKIISPLELDIFIPSKNIAIEYCGLYWHSEKILKNKNCSDTYHLVKMNKCKEKGINLITIFEDEWLFKKELVKNILRLKLLNNFNKIGARKCKIEKCQFKDVSQFLDNNHLQGKGYGGISYKIIYNGELIGSVVYSKLNIAKGEFNNKGRYELNRYCVRQGFNILGGLQRVQAQFIKDYCPKQIISYSDNRWFDGRLYENMKFQFIYITKPSYFYFRSNELKRHHRFKFRKNVLVQKYGADPAKTEWQIMQEMGYDRIWDCGTKKWVIEV